MVSIAILGEMRRHFSENLEKYRNEHLGEFVLLEQDEMIKIKESFYKTQTELNRATEKYAGLIGPTILTETILSKSDEEKRSEGLLKLIRTN